MPTIERFGQQQRDAEKKEPEGPTLNEILAHPEENVLFGKYLKQSDGGDNILAMKLYAGDLKKEDFDALNEKRNEFLEIKERASKLKERFEKNIGGIISASPELKKIVNVAGEEGIRNAIIDRMDEIAITDPERFEDLESGFSGLTGAEESVARGNERIVALCKEWGFTEDEYTKALLARESGDPYALEDLIKSKMGAFKKTFTSYGELMDQGEEIDTRADIKNRLSAVNWNLGNIGGSLSTALFENEAVREMLVANLKGEKGPGKDTSFLEMKDMLKVPHTFEGLDTAWAKYQKEHEHDDGYAIEDARIQFGDEYAENLVPKKKRGFWASIFRTLLSGGIQKRLK